jgi:hypothetical protein
MEMWSAISWLQGRAQLPYFPLFDYCPIFPCLTIVWYRGMKRRISSHWNLIKFNGRWRTVGLICGQRIGMSHEIDWPTFVQEIIIRFAVAMTLERLGRGISNVAIYFCAERFRFVFFPPLLVQYYLYLIRTLFVVTCLRVFREEIRDLMSITISYHSCLIELSKLVYRRFLWMYFEFIWKIFDFYCHEFVCMFFMVALKPLWHCRN